MTFIPREADFVFAVLIPPPCIHRSLSRWYYVKQSYFVKYVRELFRQPVKFLGPSGHERIALKHLPALFRVHATQGGHVVCHVTAAACKWVHDGLLPFRKPYFRLVTVSPCRYVTADGHAAFWDRLPDIPFLLRGNLGHDVFIGNLSAGLSVFRFSSLICFIC